MNQLMQLLQKIYDLLEQINGITTNQTTVLLELRQSDESNDNGLDIIEDMVGYKETLMNELSRVEKEFDESYMPYKGKINDPEQVELLQSAVERILNIKKQIVDAERNNVTIMNSFMSQKEARVAIPKQASQVTEAYKKQQLKT